MKGVPRYYMTNTIKANNELDNYGILTEQLPEDATRYNFKAIREYCKKNNKTLAEMTEEEINRFISK